MKLDHTHEELVALRDRSLRADHVAQAEVEALAVAAFDALKTEAMRFAVVDFGTGERAVEKHVRFEAMERLRDAARRALDLSAPSMGRAPKTDGNARLDMIASGAAMALDSLAGLARIVLAGDADAARTAAQEALAAARDPAFRLPVKGSRWAAAAAAQSYFDTLGDAPNFMEVHHDRDIVVTVQRITGESPARLVQTLRGEVDALRARAESAERALASARRSAGRYSEAFAAMEEGREAEESGR